MDRMNTSIKLQRVDVGEKRIKEVIAQPLHLAFIEAIAFNEVLLGLVKNLDSHFVASRMACFALVQSTNSEAPS
jgi:hypothetical protein